MANFSKVQYWQLIDIPRRICSYCFYKDILIYNLTYCSCQYCIYVYDSFVFIQIIQPTNLFGPLTR